MASDMMTEDRALFAKALEILRDDIAECEHAAGDCERCNLIRPILSSTAAQEALRERDELLADRRRLDKLEEEMLAEPVLLHNLDTLDGLGRPRGLGLCGGRRTLRKAIDDSMGEGGR